MSRRFKAWPIGKSLPCRVSDWVTTKDGGLGSVIRVSGTGGWADVRWRDRELGEWSKRMPLKALTVLTTIPAFGMLVTDITRAEELGHDPFQEKPA